MLVIAPPIPMAAGNFLICISYLWKSARHARKENEHTSSSFVHMGGSRIDNSGMLLLSQQQQKATEHDHCHRGGILGVIQLLVGVDYCFGQFVDDE